jgi:hypothetical protein
MKALVLEVKNGEAAVLRSDGVVVKTSQKCSVGETIELGAEIISISRRRKAWLRGGVAAILALGILSGSYSYFAVSACAYVSLDAGDSSVEFSVNRLSRVISVRALNSGSENIASELSSDMRGKRVDEAMSETVLRISEFAAEDDEAYIIAGITSDTDERAERLMESVERSAGETEGRETKIYAYDVSHDERKEAEERKMSGGRLAFERRGKPPAAQEPKPPQGEESLYPQEDLRPAEPTEEKDGSVWEDYQGRTPAFLPEDGADGFPELPEAAPEDNPEAFPPENGFEAGETLPPAPQDAEKDSPAFPGGSENELPGAPRMEAPPVPGEAQATQTLPGGGSPQPQPGAENPPPGGENPLTPPAAEGSGFSPGAEGPQAFSGDVPPPAAPPPGNQ